MTQPAPRPDLDAIAARVRNPGGTVGYWALKDIAVLLAYARSLETALERIAIVGCTAGIYKHVCTDFEDDAWCGACRASNALRPPGRDGT